MKRLICIIIAALAGASALAEEAPNEGRTACLTAARQQSELKAGKLDPWAGMDSEFNAMDEWLMIFTYNIDDRPVQVRCLWNPKTDGIILGAFGGTIYRSPE